MRKRNRVLMIIVSLLLCLVLISSCVLSGIFAKYTTKKTASAKLGFEQFGVTLELEVGDALKNACKDANGNTTYTLTTNTHTGEISFVATSLKLKPGDDFTKMIKFTIGGTANVKCKLNIDVDVTYDADNFYIPSTSSENITYMPIEFCCTYADSNGSSVANKTLYNKFVDGPKEDDNVEYVAMNAMLADFNDVVLTGNYDETNHTATDVSIERIFTPTTAAKPAVQLTYKTGSKTVNQLNFGFKWTDNSNYDVYDTYLVENKTPTFTVSYTIRIEQVQSNYTTPAVT